MSGKGNFSTHLKRMNPDYTEAFKSNTRDSIEELSRRIEKLKRQHPDMEFYYLSDRGVVAGYYLKRIAELKAELKRPIVGWPGSSAVY